jgi:hypothetical protein
VAGGARQRPRSGRKSLLDARQHGLAQVVAAIAAIGVALVLDPDQRILGGVAGDQRSRHVEQRPDQAWPAGLRPLGGHAGGARDPGPAQQAKEDRFGLIVLMVRQRQPVCTTTGKHTMARPTSGGLETLAVVARHLDMDDVERHAQLSAELGTETGPGTGVGTQAVIDVDGGKGADKAPHTQAGRAHAAGRPSRAHRKGRRTNVRPVPGGLREMPKAYAGADCSPSPARSQGKGCSLNRP